jgi:hypothetical protein
MLALTIFSIIMFVLCCIMGALLYYSIKKNLFLSEAFDEMQHQVEESLDIMDTCYQRVAAKANLELMSDDPVIRELVADMRMSKEAILLVAHKIVLTQEDEDKE